MIKIEHSKPDDNPYRSEYIRNIPLTIEHEGDVYSRFNIETLLHTNVAFYIKQETAELKEQIAQRNNALLAEKVKQCETPSFDLSPEQEAYMKQRNERKILKNAGYSMEGINKHLQISSDPLEEKKKKRVFNGAEYQEAHYPNGEKKIKYMSYDKSSGFYVVQRRKKGDLKTYLRTKDFEEARAVAVLVQNG